MATNRSQPPSNAQPSQGISAASGEGKSRATKSKSGSGEAGVQQTLLQNPRPLPPPKYERRIWFTILYHVTLWLVLALITSPLFYLFAHPSTSKYPAYYGYGSLIGNKSKLSIIPRLAYNYSTDYQLGLKYDNTNSSTYDSYVKDLNNIVQTYINTTGNGTNCFGNGDKNLTEDFFCTVNLHDAKTYGECGNYGTPGFDFGFQNGTPCLLMRLNRILDFLPVGYNIDFRNDSDFCENNKMKIGCNEKSDNESTPLDVTIYPKDGISLCYWPFTGQVNYHSPAAFLRINQMPNSTRILYCAPDTPELKLPDSEDEWDDTPHILRLVVEPLNTTST